MKAAALVLLLVGCGPEEYCDGNIAHHCFEDDHGRRCVATDCGDNFCVEAGDGAEALCVPTATPDAACDSTLGFSLACTGSQLVECSYEYAVDVHDCGSAELCDARSRQCLARPGIDARCAEIMQMGLTTYCDGQYDVACSGMFATRIFDCGSPTLCHTTATGSAGCILSTTLDPRCPTPAIGTGFSTVCDGTLAVNCFDGYTHSTEDCSAPDADLYTCSACGS